MPATLYGGGTLYGSGALYARIASGLATAQSQRVRETGLVVQVLDEGLNRWTYHAGTQSYPDEGLGRGLYRPPSVAAHLHNWDIEHWAYQGFTDFVVLNNGNIVRIRLGDPADVNDRQIYIQTITAPGTASQWTSGWSVLYSGTHYGIELIRDSAGTGYIVYHPKSDGLYRNNTKVIDNSSDLNGLSANDWIPVQGDPDHGWIRALSKDTVEDRRVYTYFYTQDVTGGTCSFDYYLNYTWTQAAFAAILSSDGLYVHGIFGAPLHFNPGDLAHGSELTYFRKTIATGEVTPFYPIRGIGGGAGTNYITGASLHEGTDGYYYLFGNEMHLAGQAVASTPSEDVTSLGFGLPFWSRSKDLQHWSEPVIGPAVKNTWGVAGVVESGGYMYWTDSELVYRRPVGTTTYDVSNYVTELSFDLPRDNQPGSGEVKIANPVGVNDALKDLSDREIVIQPGLKTADGTYEFMSFSRFFIRQCNDLIEGQADRLTAAIGDIWARLENPMRDVTNFVGQTVWDDFATGKRNEPFNYFFVADVAPSVDDEFRLHTTGIALWTGWKGHNPDITVNFYSVSAAASIIARYVDGSNYMKLEVNGGTTTLSSVVNGASTTIDSWSPGNPGSAFKLRLRLRWGRYEVWLNDTLLEDNFQTLPQSRVQGYVGTDGSTYQIGNLHVTDYEYPLMTSDLVKTALAMGDFHDVSVTGGTSRMFAIVWGPQTDVDDPSKALATALEADKLSIIWRNGQLEVGKFDDPTIVKTIQDEVISSESVDEAKRRLNLVSVDGSEHFWLEVDTVDTNERGRQIVGYFDLPELLDKEAVVARAKEEIANSIGGGSPGGVVPLFFDLWRMDRIAWFDNRGNGLNAKIEGFSVEINQSEKPFQRQTLDMSILPNGLIGGLVQEVIPSDADSR